MKVHCVFSSRLASLLNVSAITVYPFIFFADDREAAMDMHIVAHEYVHVLQVRKLGWLRFYWTYLLQYFRQRFAGRSDFEAYMGVNYEIEAYAEQATQVVPPGFC